MKRYPCVLQEGMKDCGVASLLTIIKTYGGVVPKEHLRVLTNTTKNGVNAFSLIEAGKILGFDAKGVTGRVFDIDKKNLPCIAHVIIDNKYKHFVVIHEIDKIKNKIVIADPAKGIQNMTREEFEEIATNNYLFFIPNKEIPKIIYDNKIYEIIHDFIINNKNTVIITLFFSIIITLFSIMTSYSMKIVIDRVFNYNSLSNLYVISLIFIFVYLIKNITEYYRNLIIMFVSNKLDFQLTNETFSHILSLPHLYYKNRTTGEVLSRITDLSELREIISYVIVTLFIDVILFILSLTFLFLLNFKMTFTIISILIFYIFLMIILNRFINSKFRIVKEENSIVNSYMIELINAIDTIKGMNIKEEVKEKFSLKYDSYLNSGYSLSKIANYQNFTSNLFDSLLNILLIIIGGKLVISMNLSLGSLITYSSILIYLFSATKNLIGIDIMIKKSKIVIDRINELLNIKREDQEFSKGGISYIDGAFEIRNLDYSYNKRDYLFKKLNFKVSKGEKILMLGKSGSGKSTFAKILAGYLKIDRGYIMIDNNDINDYSMDTIRKNITYVSQNEFLFTDSIYNNIDFIKTRDEKEILKTCKLFTVDEIIKNKSSGYNSLLEENGSNISGGERQRIILSRTFLKDSSIYILDESFSEIDILKERQILNNIFEKYKDKTIIVISHRKDNSDLYDRVIDFNLELNGN